MTIIETTLMGSLESFSDWFGKHTVLGAPLPMLTKFLGFLVAGWFLGRLLRYPVGQWLERLTPETDHTTSVRVSRNMERGIFLLVLAIVLKSGALDILHLPGWAWEKTHYATTILLAIASTLLFFQIVEITLIGLDKRWRGAHQEGIDTHLTKFLRKGIRIFVILVVVLVTADNIGFKVSGAIAGLGIGGAAIALGAQGLIANLLGTIEVVADRLYRVGDRIHFDHFDGFVVDVGLRSTKIRALSGEQVIVPNKRMAEVQIRNFSRNGLVRTTAAVGIVYSTTHDQTGKAMQILEEIFKDRKDVQSQQIYLKNLGAYALELEIIFWAHYNTSPAYNDLIGQVHMEIKRRFDAAGIEFAFPTQTVQITQTT